MLAMSSAAGVGWARDADIRDRLREEISRQHEGERDTVLVEEMGLCEGEARLDLGVINGRFIGYEIKSPRDTLTRLPRQVDVYSRTLDEVEIVTCETHLAGVLALVPEWWGVRLVEADGDSIVLRSFRAASPNPGWDPRSLVQLLWRNETLEVLAELGCDRGVRTKPKLALWERLVESVTREKLHSIVLSRVKAREGWTTARPLG